MNYSHIFKSSLFALLITALVLFFFASNLVSGPAHAAQAANSAKTITITSPIVCAPDSHAHCHPGPFTEELKLVEPTKVLIDVYLVHTGHYEPNEQSAFLSPLGNLLDCGPIPPDADEIYCGQVSGYVKDILPMSIQHTGGGASTGSHQQRYVITLCEKRVFFPMIMR